MISNFDHCPFSIKTVWTYREIAKYNIIGVIISVMFAYRIKSN